MCFMTRIIFDLEAWAELNGISLDPARSSKLETFRKAVAKISINFIESIGKIAKQQLMHFKS